VVANSWEAEGSRTHETPVPCQRAKSSCRAPDNMEKKGSLLEARPHHERYGRNRAGAVILPPRLMEGAAGQRAQETQARTP
jgi:hypothetical protein